MLWVSNFSLSLSSIGVTFLSPNKKVTKEVGIGEALMPRSRATSAPSPVYPSRARFKILRDVLTT